ncbi:MAG TPA: FAD-dependent monooxygenase [Caulobacteraceae bacterium]|nr:FAD-dependent monooxygenase [Caulobacteraceae bacterium]
MSRPVQALIVGGGPAGASLAIRLAEAGRRVLLLERERGAHDKVCGEFISGEAAASLANLGVDLTALGAQPIDTVRLARGGKVVQTALPFRALSLSRRRLDEALLIRAEHAGAEVRQGCKVKALEQTAGGWRASVEGGGSQEAQDAFLASGKHELKGRKRRKGLQNDLIAFKLHWRLSPDQAAALSGAVELSLFDGGYAGLEAIEAGKANLCLVVRQARFAALGSWPALLAAIRADCALLDRRLTGAGALWDKPLAIAAIPYGQIARAPSGPWPLGDQAAVIPSFAGDGLAIALHSAALAAQVYLGGGSAQDYVRRIGRELGARVIGATWLSQALVRGPGQAAIMAAAALEPQLMAAAARLTRIPEGAIRRAAAGV